MHFTMTSWINQGMCPISKFPFFFSVTFSLTTCRICIFFLFANHRGNQRIDVVKKISLILLTAHFTTHSKIFCG